MGIITYWRTFKQCILPKVSFIVDYDFIWPDVAG